MTRSGNLAARLRAYADADAILGSYTQAQCEYEAADMIEALEKRIMDRSEPTGVTQMTPVELTAERERMGLTQARLAELLGIHARTVSSWEQGRQAIPPFLRLALQALDTPGSAW